MAKLTLSVDDQVISRAKKYAKSRGVSVSEMVETFLAAVVTAPTSPEHGLTPVLRSIRGVLQNADPRQYKEHLAAKYQ